MPTRKRKTLILSVILVIFFLDQLSKYFVASLLSVGESIPVIKDIFHISLVRNTGAAFGILKGELYLLLALTLIVTIFFAIKLRKETVLVQTLGMSLILAGAIGNLTDRIRLGVVIDFLDFRIWPVFNIADSAITIGAVLLGFYFLKKCRNIA
ncbi:MAG: signal peptidase II [Candidatus Omnitrophica bacterium]|nr:signal peptidase II [Candidatus Omnitrophota bacterium]